MDIDASLDSELEISRYMSFAKFASLCQTSALFFPALSSFTDDPHEGSSTFLNEAHETGLFAALDAFANNYSAASFGIGLDDATRQRLRAEGDAKTKAERFVETVFGKLLISPGRTHKDIVRSQRQWLDVSCWHAGADESLAMWRIYGGAGDSVCICTDVRRLAAALTLAPGQMGYIGRVRYIDHRQQYFDVDHPLMPALHKRLPFIYEDEVRAISWDRSADPMQRREGSPGSFFL